MTLVVSIGLKMSKFENDFVKNEILLKKSSFKKFGLFSHGVSGFWMSFNLHSLWSEFVVVPGIALTSAANFACVLLTNAMPIIVAVPKRG